MLRVGLTPKVAALVVVGLAFFTDTAVYSMLPPLLPEYARVHALSQTRLGLLFSSYAGALLLAAMPMGIWVDRRGRRGAFLGGLLGFGVATILFAYAGSLATLILARILQGLAAAATWVAGLAMVADHCPSNQRGKAMSAVFACANVGMFLGPAFSGLMIRLWSIKAAFLFAAALAGLDALVRFTLLPVDPPAQPPGAVSFDLLKDRTVRILAGVMVLGAALGALLEAVLPLHLSRDLGMDAVAIGLAFTTGALASTFTSPFVGHWTDLRGPREPLRMGLALGAGVLAVAPYVASRIGIHLLMVVFGATGSLLMSPCGPAVAARVEHKGGTAFGTVFSLLNLAFSLGLMAGPILGSALTDLLGLNMAMGLLSLGLVAYLLPISSTS
jgi:multidrug resistance protein